MIPSPHLDKLKAKREDIIKGEIGALLHDIGKLHSKFYQKHCEGGTGEYYPHHKISNTGIISRDLIDLLKGTIFVIDSVNTNLLDLIENHHPKRNEDTPGDLASLLIKCDRIDSGDDKGVVRKNQPINNTIIVSGFGKEKPRIDLNCIDKYLKELDENLTNAFNLYLNGKADIFCFRDAVITSIKEPFTSALGETRIPANDVTLFDHSFSTASLYKTQLARAVLENEIKSTEEWRVFGIFWNGARFMSRARKAADALNRQEIINEVKKELKQLFEVEYPIGNTIFEDADSIFFTFPAFDKLDELAKECMIKAVDIIRTKSNSDLWPICALSQPRRSPTVIAEMMEFFETKKGIEKQSSVLYIDSENIYSMDNPPLEFKIPYGNKKYDICPVCRIRAKKEKYHDTCDACLERRRGRIKGWAENRNKTETIWMDEVADENNRVALISMEFGIKDWLNGKWLQSLWVQTIQDWIDNLKNSPKQLRNIENSILKNEGIIKNDISELNVVNAIKLLEVIATKPKDKETQRKDAFLTFFNKGEAPDDQELTDSIKDIENRSTINGEIQYKLFNYLFNKHPSPARLRRVWRETEDFIQTLQNNIHERVFPLESKRLILEEETQISPKDLSQSPTWKAIEISGLNPDTFQIVQINDTGFTTITNLSEYEYRNGNKDKMLKGFDAVKKAIESSKKLKIINEEDKEGKSPAWIQIKNVKPELYIPTITILKSPYQFQMLMPASSVPEVLEAIKSRYDKCFSKVNGKLPINVSVLVANRVFPLYVLLESASRMLRNHESFGVAHEMEPYWIINGEKIDPYYSFYPTDENISPEKLISVQKGKKFFLSPGYFDFDFLGGTADMSRIFYSGNKKPQRDSINYGWIKPRPYYFYRIKDILKLRIILNKLTRTQVNGIEQALVAKLERWNEYTDHDKDKVFREFGKNVIVHAFTPKNWWNMPKNDRDLIEVAIDSGLLLDTIQFFNHVLKVKIGSDENE